ncbi:MAG TPA: HEAT repeat domain-containing protein [Polyangia bacterium]|nr:HEAT repeat domain-containing protein [Polyangia bacterium]
MSVLLLAAVLAQTTADLDGDGRPDTVRVLADGRVQAVSATDSPLGELTLETQGHRLVSARVAVHQIQEHAVIEARAALRGRATDTALVAEARGDALYLIWSGILGSQGRDREWSRHLEVTTEAILVYERSTRIARCDGQPTRLLPRAWDFTTYRMRPVELPPDTTGLPRLAPRRPGEPERPVEARRPLRVFRPAAGSRDETARTAGELTVPVAIGDGDPRTAWRGIPGDFVTLRAEAQTEVRGVALTGKLGRSVLALGPEKRFLIEGTGWFALPESVRTDCVQLTVVEGASEIADLAVQTETDPQKLAVEAAAGSGMAARLLLAEGAAAVERLRASFAQARGEGRLTALEALAAVGSPAALPELADALRAGDAREREIAARGLIKIGAPAAPATAQLLLDATAPAAARERAAAVLGALPSPDALAALLTAAGSGDRSLRKAVVVAAGAAATPNGYDALVAFTSAQSTGAQSTGAQPTGGQSTGAQPTGAQSTGTQSTSAQPTGAQPSNSSSAPDIARAADLARIVGLLARRDVALRPDAVRVLADRLPKAQVFELRVRIIQALGATGDPQAARALAQSAHGDSDEIIRFEAVRALAELPGREALSALFAALGDAAPRVRDAAALGLGARKEPFPPASLAHTLLSDRWMFVRRDAAEALGAHCGSEATPALRTAARASDEDDDVRRAALAALVRCKDGVAPRLALQVAAGPAEDVHLRAEACGLASATGDPAILGDLTGLVRRLRTQAASDDRASGIATACLRALGGLAAAPHAGGARATAEKLLVEVVQDGAHPPLQIAAVEGLAHSCGDAAKAALTKAATTEAPLLRRAARSALDRCTVGHGSPPSH